jgi:hypothetical protein
VEAADLDVLLLEHLQTPREGIGNPHVAVVLVGAARSPVVKRRLHLADGGDHLLCLLDHPLLLGRHETDLVVQGIGERCKELP